MINKFVINEKLYDKAKHQIFIMITTIFAIQLIKNKNNEHQIIIQLNFIQHGINIKKQFVGVNSLRPTGVIFNN